MRDGIVVLDTTCYARLEHAPALERFRANLRAAWLYAAPSEVNLLEAIATPDPSVRRRLMLTMKVLLEDGPLLAWPFDILKGTAEALLRGESQLAIDFSGKEWYLDDEGASADLQTAALEASRDMERRFDELHAGVRIPLRRKMRERGWVDSWEEIRTFLDEYWRPSDMPAHFADATWSALKLPGNAPMNELLSIPVWRLMTDADGVAVYARALAHTQPRKVQRKDLIQLVYLGASDRRIIATADKPFLAAATAVLAGHGNARAIHIEELIV